jgi:threonine dehydrogenase-like Zn-dependent dehydrogenase
MNVQFAELVAPGQLEFRTAQLPKTTLAPHQVLAKTLFSAVSPGTEVAAFANAPPLRPSKMYPRLVGYCNLAEVIGVGSAVTDLKPAARILTHQSHRSAFICEEDQILARVSPEIDGATASTTYLFHLGYNALLRGGFQPGFRVAVLGLGLLGLTTVSLARVFGGEVIGLSNYTEARDAAREFGAAITLAKDRAQIEKELTDLTGNEGVDLVVTTSNRWEDWELALRIPRAGGTIAVLGFPGRGQLPPSFNPLGSETFYDRQLTIVACGYSPFLHTSSQDLFHSKPRNCQILLRLIGRGQLPARRLITDIVPWDQLDVVYRRLIGRQMAPGTTVLDWRDCNAA